jgi:hypothetical protein
MSKLVQGLSEYRTSSESEKYIVTFSVADTVVRPSTSSHGSNSCGVVAQSVKQTAPRLLPSSTSFPLFSISVVVCYPLV